MAMIFWIRVGHTGFMVRTNTVSVVSGGKLEGNSLCGDKMAEWNMGNSFFPFFCRGKSLRGDRKLSCPIYGYLSLPSGPLFCSNIFVGKAPREGNWKMPRKRGEGGEPEAGNEPWDQKESTLRRKTKKGTDEKKERSDGSLCANYPGRRKFVLGWNSYPPASPLRSSAITDSYPPGKNNKRWTIIGKKTKKTRLDI